ncbi:hypothetical protein ONZ45_g18865 [Pleurotus djamor]|nr:hypothetical protein ONZ45_g18865 [Pleurotus djamor]
MDSTAGPSSRKRKKDEATTPKKSSQTVSFHDTPYRITADEHQSQSLQTHSSAKRQRRQAELMTILTEELAGSVFESVSLRDTLCPDPHKMAGAVVAELLKDTNKYRITGNTVSITGWPTTGDETRFYGPIVLLVNDIIDAFIKVFPEDAKQSFLIRRGRRLDLVSTITGMLLWKNSKDAGYCTSQSHSHFSINSDPYRTVNVLCRRNPQRGRATRVFGLKRESPGIISPGPPDSLHDPTRKPRDTVEPLLRPTPARPDDTFKIEGITFPETLVVKCSYPLVSRPREEDVLTFKSKNYMGVVNILCAHDAETITIPPDALPWNVLDSGTGQQPEVRLHRHIFFKTHGRPLRGARGPRELGIAILHAMIGHYAVFTQRGYVHRDVSNGNILLLSSPEDRDIPPGLEDIGTKPFIAHRILESWSSFGVRQILHTPIDDLESFIWVLYYSLLDITKKPNDDEITALGKLSHDNLDTVNSVKNNIISTYTKFTARLFPALLGAWFRTADQYAVKLLEQLHGKAEPPFDEVKALCITAYLDYIKEGVELVPQLPEDWN